MGKRRQHTARLPGQQLGRPSEPLWQLAPVCNADGEAVADFMMLIPRLQQRGPVFAETVRQRVHAVCRSLQGQVLFVDLNLRTGALWISVEARPGLCARVARAIRAQVPEALSVGGQLELHAGELSAHARRQWRVQRWLAVLSRIPRRAWRRPSLSPPDNAPR